MSGARCGRRTLLVLLLVCGGCVTSQSRRAAPDVVAENSERRARGKPCDIDGPENRMPAAARTIRVGMARQQVRRVLGTPDHSPVAGQDYHSTGGDCVIAGGNRTAPCGLVIEYRMVNDRGIHGDPTGEVRQCWWGGIGE